MNKIFTITIAILGLLTITNAQGITNVLGGNTDDDKFTLENNDGDPLLTVTGAGDIGFGTSDPDYKFVIRDYSSSGMKMQNSYSGYNPNDGFIISLSGSYDEAWIYNYEDGPISFGTNGHTRMTIRNDGRIGIGELFPVGGLHLKGNDYPNSFMFLESVTDRDAGFRLVEGGTTMWHIFNNGTNNSKFYIRNNAYHPCISIDQASGNIGVGTSTPKAVLDVNGRIRVGDDDSTPEAGQIKFKNGEFYGYTGTTWKALDYK